MSLPNESEGRFLFLTLAAVLSYPHATHICRFMIYENASPITVMRAGVACLRGCSALRGRSLLTKVFEIAEALFWQMVLVSTTNCEQQSFFADKRRA